MKPLRKKIVAVLTLIFFFSTMSVFVAYKAGAFGSEFENSVQAVFFPAHARIADSPGKDSGAVKEVLIPSSKVMIGTVEPKTSVDSASKKNNANVSGDESDRQPYIYSTKSGPVFEPRKDTQPRDNNNNTNVSPK